MLLRQNLRSEFLASDLLRYCCQEKETEQCRIAQVRKDGMEQKSSHFSLISQEALGYELCHMLPAVSLCLG